jgi:26S proteasome regulatory subunit N8
MFHKISSKEKVVGWYSTGPQIRPADLAINELVRRYVDHPVLVIVDVNPTDNLEIPTQAYVSMEDVPEKRSVSPKTFVHLPSEIGAYEAEEVGVEHLVREIRDIGGSTVADMVSDKIASLKGMLKRLGQIEEYLDLVMAKKVVANHQIMYNIQNIFNSMPALDTKDIIQSFKVVTNDNSLVLYVSSLIRSILALDGVISNKIKNRNIEAARLADLEAAALAKETAAIEAEKAKTEEKKTMDTNED